MHGSASVCILPRMRVICGDLWNAAGLFMTVTTTNELSVDTSRGDQLQIHVSSIRNPTMIPASVSASVVQAQC